MANMVCDWCNKSLKYDTDAARFLGICQDCRMSKGYSECPKSGHDVNAGAYSFKDGLCLSCDKDMPAGVTVVAKQATSCLVKVYVGECPCGIQHPATCEYHTIQPGSRLA